MRRGRHASLRRGCLTFPLSGQLVCTIRVPTKLLRTGTKSSLSAAVRGNSHPFVRIELLRAAQASPVKMSFQAPRLEFRATRASFRRLQIWTAFRSFRQISRDLGHISGYGSPQSSSSKNTFRSMSSSVGGPQPTLVVFGSGEHLHRSSISFRVRQALPPTGICGQLDLRHGIRAVCSPDRACRPTPMEAGFRDPQSQLRRGAQCKPHQLPSESIPQFTFLGRTRFLARVCIIGIARRNGFIFGVRWRLGVSGGLTLRSGSKA